MPGSGMGRIGGEMRFNEPQLVIDIAGDLGEQVGGAGIDTAAPACAVAR